MVMASNIFADKKVSNDSIANVIHKCWDLTYNDSDSAFKLAHHALKLSTDNMFTSGCINGYHYLGILHDIRSNFDSSLYYYNKAYELSEATNDSVNMAGTICNIGLTYWHIGRYQSALEYFYDALAWFELKHPKSRNMVSTYNNIGMIYNKLEDYENALLIYKKALEINKELKDTINETALLTNLGDTYQGMGNYEKAWEVFQKALRYKKLNNDNYGISLVSVELADLHLELDSLEKAKQCIQDCFKYCGRTGNQSIKVDAYQLMSEMYQKQGEIQRPLRYTMMAYELAKKIESLRLQKDCCETLSDLYALEPDYENAFKYQQEYSRLNDSLVNRHQLSYIYDLKLNQEIDQKSHEIALLNELKANQKLTIEKQELKLKNRNLLIIIIAGLLVLILSGGYIWYIRVRYRQKQKLDRQALMKKEELASRTMEAELNERERISKDLHDSLGQYLGFCKLQLSRYSKRSVPQADGNNGSLNKVIQVLDESIDEVRNIIHNLSPSMLQQKGFARAVNDLVERFNQLSGTRIHLDMEGLEAGLDYITGNTLYRVIQEVLTNALKYSGADKITLQVIRGDNDVTVMVEDNGKGFDPSENGKGMGLRNIRTRMENIHGKVYLDSRINRGTIVTLNAPVK
ncbi:MAG: sensor histidine kinase [Bacteroidales bacterium]|nr:sensor histidine kinase [Bacteroidales bacterium]